MTDIQIDPTVKVTFGFERKVTDGNYGSSQASAYASADIPVDADQAQYVEALGRVAQAVRAAVYAELGIAVFLDEDGILREKETPLVTQNAVERVVNSQFPQAPAAAGGGGEFQDGVKVCNFAKTNKEPIPAGILHKMKADGVTEVWDNRGTATGRQPLFKESTKSAEANGRDPLAFWKD